MNILIPMAGAGSRFVQEGYAQHKPVIPTTQRHTGQKVPMAVAAVADLPVDAHAPDCNLIFIVRDFHVTDGVTDAIQSYYPRARFIVIDRLTDGQASTCLLARDIIDNDQPLLIAACDNGMELFPDAFEKASSQSDALIITFRNNEAVCAKPQSYGWILTEGDKALGVSIKTPISTTPMEDHAVVGNFWFRRGHDFIAAADAMIAADDRINGEFYVDQVFKYLISSGLDVRVLECERYLCWGTPTDYEAYENTIRYWRDFLAKEKTL
ncbi:nucleotidyltransferase [Asaia spathodeae]|uniref:hypothetical protein n=1 Tax=Asaia spathodeae TaxID=657016 RepID=UPI002FC3DE34